MRYVLDASVAVSAVRPNEPDHVSSRLRLAALLSGEDEIAVPVIFSIEVAGALARGGSNAPQIDRYLATLAAHTIETATIGARRAPRIRRVAITARLRAADATYVWLAATRGLTLVTLDRDVLARAAGMCAVSSP